MSTKVPLGATQDQANHMLQNLLAERFGLKLHHETREVSGYELVVARNGPKLKPTSDPAAAHPTGAAPKQVLDADGFPMVPHGLSTTEFATVDNGNMRVTGQSQFMFDLILTIETSLNDGKRVVDKTGLTGKYDFKMDLALDGGFRRPGGPQLTADDTPGSAKAGLVYFVLDRVSIVGSGQLAIGPVNRQLNEGESLFSEAGRAEVLLNPGTVLRIGAKTRIRMEGVELTDTRISIETGSAVVTVRQLPKLDRVAIHIGRAVVVMKSDGVYRFDADLDTSTPRLRVFSGQAEAYRKDGVPPEEGGLNTLAKHGQAVQLQDLLVSKFDREDTDELQHWRRYGARGR